MRIYSPGLAVGRSVGYHIVKHSALGGGTPHRSLINTMLTTAVHNSANHTCRVSWMYESMSFVAICFSILSTFVCNHML